MGIAAPLTRFGYCATDTTMYKDTTEYTTTSVGTEELLLTLTQIEEISLFSTLRFKCECKMDAGSTNFYCKLRDENENFIGTIYGGADLVYTAASGDLPSLLNYPVWKRSGEIKVYGYIETAGKGYVKNIEIAGSRTPYLEV
jgi:hypothetical protein